MRHTHILKRKNNKNNEKEMNPILAKCKWGGVKTAFFALLLCANVAQAQNSKYVPSTWVGQDYTKLTTNTERFWLYNVGTKTIIAAGGEWGTQAVLKYNLFGNAFTLETTTNGSGGYLINAQMQNQTGTSGKYLGANYINVTTGGSWGDGITSCTAILEARNTDTNPSTYTRVMNFVRVEDAGDTKSYTYYLKEDLAGKSNHTVYLGAKKGINPNTGTDNSDITEPIAGENIVIYTEKEDVWKDNDCYKWRIITETQMIGLTDDSGDLRISALDANVSFNVKDPFFDRNHTNDYINWKVTNSTTTTAGSSTYRWNWTGQSAWQNFNNTTYNGKYDLSFSSGSGTTSGATTTEAWDRGFATRVQYNTMDEGKYGMTLFDGIGTFYQTFTASESGYYWVDCRGICQSANNDAKLFIKTTDDNKAEVSLYKATGFQKVTTTTSGNNAKPGAKGSTLLTLAKALHENTNNQYTVETARIWVEKGATVTVGISKSAATQTLASRTGSYNNYTYYYYDTDIVAIDNVNLEYSRNTLVLDEDRSSGSYMTEKNDDHTNIFLHRTFTKDKWNSLVLPVSMTKAQVVSCFGSEAKVAEYHGVSTLSPQLAYNIEFQSIKLDDKQDGDVVIEAGNMYIVKPTNAEGGYTVTDIAGYEGAEDDVLTSVSGCYELGRMAFHGSSLAQPKSTQGTHGSESKVATLEYVGTYTHKAANAEGGTVAGSYMLWGGQMYHLATSNEIWGFRGWLNAVDADGNVDRQAKLAMRITDGGTTYIDGISENTQAGQTAVYSLDGKRVATTTAGLRKGVYVVNGKKMVVR